MDLFALSMPLTFDGISITPWVMPGMMGRNTGKFGAFTNYGLNDGSPATTLYPYLNKIGAGHGLNVTGVTNASKEYGTVFWAGLPVKVTALEPWNIEFDTNYGFVEQLGSFNVMRRNNANAIAESALHLDITRDLKRIDAHIAATVYGTLEKIGMIQLPGDMSTADVRVAWRRP